MKAINIEWDLTDDVFDYNIDDCDIPTIVELPKDLATKVLTDYFNDEKGLQTNSYKLSSVADYLSDTYGFCVLSFEVVKDFEDLDRDELWEIRKQIVLNSLFEYNYFVKEGYNPCDLSSFFDGYVDYLYEIAEDNGGEWTDYDNKDNLFCWYNCYDDLSWVRLENE
jgi:hypothetical protein